MYVDWRVSSGWFHCSNMAEPTPAILSEKLRKPRMSIFEVGSGNPVQEIFSTIMSFSRDPHEELLPKAKVSLCFLNCIMLFLSASFPRQGFFHCLHSFPFPSLPVIPNLPLSTVLPAQPRCSLFLPSPGVHSLDQPFFPRAFSRSHPL